MWLRSPVLTMTNHTRKLEFCSSMECSTIEPVCQLLFDDCYFTSMCINLRPREMLHTPHSWTVLIHILEPSDRNSEYVSIACWQLKRSIFVMSGQWFKFTQCMCGRFPMDRKWKIQISRGSDEFEWEVLKLAHILWLFFVQWV